MMVDNTENNEFRVLLSDYTTPISDDGFSEHVLIQAPNSQKIAPQNIGMIKRLMIGGAALLAALIAVPQLGKLQQFLASIRVPEVSLPTHIIETNFIENANMSSLTTTVLLAVLVVGFASSVLFSSDI